MPYQPILATLGYVFSADRERVLLCHRTARPGHHHYGKWNGIGGKLERGEDIVTGFLRELHEETGLTASRWQLAGTISWPGFGLQGEDWFGFLFRVLEFQGTPYTANNEGTLHWVPRAEVAGLNLWDGDRYFLDWMLDPAGPSFHGVMPYFQGQPQSWSYRIGQNPSESC